MIDKKFDKWTVIGFDKYNKFGLKLWKCQCECGYEQSFTTSYINTGKLSKCKICRQRIKLESFLKRKNHLIGNKFNDWTVLGFSHQGKNSRTKYWDCQCKCGQTRKIATVDIISKNTKRPCCRKCAGENYSEKFVQENGELSTTKWNRIKRRAKRDEIDFLITKEQTYELFLKQDRKCAISNLDISFGYAKNADTCTASLDRIDSTKPYSIGNVQWLHKKVNFMKHSLDQMEFFGLCKIIIEYQLTLQQKTLE